MYSTPCRGGAESVLTLSSTVIGVVLHRLGANLTRRKGKYTSASPRCTCLPSRQICIGVALGDPPQTPLQCGLVGRTSTPWLRLGVLVLPTSQHCTEVALGGEQVHQGQVHLCQVEVQLGFASLNFNLASMDLALMYLFSSSCNFSSRPPRPSSTRLHLVELGLGL